MLARCAEFMLFVLLRITRRIMEHAFHLRKMRGVMEHETGNLRYVDGGWCYEYETTMKR